MGVTNDTTRRPWLARLVTAMVSLASSFEELICSVQSTAWPADH